LSTADRHRNPLTAQFGLSTAPPLFQVRPPILADPTIACKDGPLASVKRMATGRPLCLHANVRLDLGFSDWLTGLTFEFFFLFPNQLSNVRSLTFQLAATSQARISPFTEKFDTIAKRVT
jgi:hypothetical protein